MRLVDPEDTNENEEKNEPSTLDEFSDLIDDQVNRSTEGEEEEEE